MTEPKRMTVLTDDARSMMAQGLRAMADALEQGAVHVSGGAIFQPLDDGAVFLNSNLVLAMPVTAAGPPTTNPAHLPPDVRQKLIHARDAWAAGDGAEAHHWIYQIACPSLECLDPWAAVEGRVCSCGPHPMRPGTSRAVYGAGGKRLP